MNQEKINRIVNYIKTQLGHPVVKIEITDDMIQEFIYNAVRKIANNNCDTAFKQVPALPCQVFEAETVIRVYDNRMIATMSSNTDIFSINIIRKGLYSGSLKDISISQAYQDFSSSLTTHSFKFHDDKLYIDGLTGMVVVEYIPKVEDLEFSRVDEDWVTRYALALSKEALGRIRGKFTPGTAPFTMDHEALLSEANEEKQRLEDELSEKGYGFFFVDSDNG